MLIGRARELRQLEALNEGEGVAMIAVTGQRRIGKSALVKEFMRPHAKDALYLDALELGDSLNLERFAKAAGRHFHDASSEAIATWDELFAFIGRQGARERLIVAFDDLQFLLARNRNFLKILRRAVDAQLHDKRITLILLGTNMDEVTGTSSPLHGHFAAMIALKSFDCFDSVRFLPHYGVEDKLCAYAILGGVPGYLRQFDPMLSLKDNLTHHVVRAGAFLRDEPQTILKGDLREISIYNAILQAIARGKRRLSEISSCVHESVTSCSKYLDTLTKLKITVREYPCGESARTRNGRYALRDRYFSFWYSFIFGGMDSLTLTDETHWAQEILSSQDFARFMERAFVQICREFLERKMRRGELPFSPSSIGGLWGRGAKDAGDGTIELMLADESGAQVLIAGCKYGYEPFGKTDLEALLQKGTHFPRADKLYFCVFSRSGFSEQVKAQARVNGDLLLYELFDLFTPVWARRGV